MALVNDTFLQLVKKETHRGLEGRALQGFATGGRCYGYTSVPEENPPDAEHPRRVPVVEPVEAALVLRIFQMFADGASCQQIAYALNGEDIPAPHDGGKGNKQGRGWGHTTIRAMLLKRALHRSLDLEPAEVGSGPGQAITPSARSTGVRARYEGRR